MKAKKEILCTECGQPIRYKQELIVVGKVAQPFHKDCFKQSTTWLNKLNRFGGYTSLSTIGFWMFLILFNAGAAFMLRAESEKRLALWVFIVICNMIYISSRISVYLQYERHLD